MIRSEHLARNLLATIVSVKMKVRMLSSRSTASRYLVWCQPLTAWTGIDGPAVDISLHLEKKSKIEGRCLCLCYIGCLTFACKQKGASLALGALHIRAWTGCNHLQTACVSWAATASWQPPRHTSSACSRASAVSPPSRRRRPRETLGNWHIWCPRRRDG